MNGKQQLVDLILLEILLQEGSFAQDLAFGTLDELVWFILVCREEVGFFSRIPHTL
jgi:hypothetical protein